MNSNLLVLPDGVTRLVKATSWRHASISRHQPTGLYVACRSSSIYQLKIYCQHSHCITMRDRPCYANGCHTSADGLFLERRWCVPRWLPILL